MSHPASDQSTISGTAMTTYRLEATSELMQNYLQAQILLPEDKFEAQQTDAGTALLFSIGTGGVLFLTKEVPGIAHGWQRADLSSAQIKQDLPAGRCTNFASALSVPVPGQAGSIHLAMVVNDGANDHLYLSLSNSASDTAWSAAPVWLACPFNGGAPPSQLAIAGVQISEASDGEFIVVDIVGNPGNAVPLLARYYIDVSQAGAPQWVKHNVPIDIETAVYASCLGRSRSSQDVDGLYLAGKVDGAAQLVYSPLYNPFNPALPPLSRRLALPGNLIADTIAACRNADNTSDLYATANGALYYFSAANQADGAQALKVIDNPLFEGLRKLFASVAGGRVTVWGLNAADQVMYSSADQAHVAEPGGWSRPSIILSAVDAMSPYLDRDYSANTFFAHTAHGLVKVVKSPGTGLWRSHDIILPPQDTQAAATRISSYTSHVQVTGADGLPAAEALVGLSASNVTSVYVNHLYYVVGPKPIMVTADTTGSIAIVESVKTLSGTRFTLTIGDQSLTVNPMDAAAARMDSLGSVEGLRAAVITANDGSTRPLVASAVPDSDLDTVARSNTALKSAYGALSSPSMRTLAASAAPYPHTLAAFPDAIAADLGDLFSWLESGVESLVSIVKDAATDAWHFVAHIAGEVYQGVLDCAEKVMGAIKWVFNAIKTAIEDLILFLEFLFAWKDILVTHRVMKNVFNQYVQHAIGSLGQDKAAVTAAFTQLQTAIDRWADIPDFGPAAAGVTTDDSYGAQHSAPGNLGLHHYKGNAANGVAAYQAPSPSEAIFQDLMTLLEQEGDTLSGACNAIKTDIVDQFGTLSATDILKKFAAILTDTLLQSAEHIIVAAIDVLAQLATGFVDMLNSTIDIPVLSWLYRELTGDDLSILDLVCLVAAIPATILHKAAAGHVPFPKGDAFTDALLDAGSFAQVQAAFQVQPSVRAAGVMLSDAPPVLDETRLKVFGFVTGLFAFAGCIVQIVTMTIDRVLDAAGVDNARPKTLAVLSCMGNLMYVSPNIATFINVKSSNWYQQMNNVLTGISILKGFAAIPFASTNSAVKTYGFAGVESVINLAWNVPVIMNIVDNHARWDDDYKSLIPESIGNFGFNFGGMLELIIAKTKDVDTILAQYAMMGAYGVCMPVAGGIYEFVPGQNHGA
jgi:hypothetical protein